MTRNAIILILVCALAGAAFHIWQSDQFAQAQKVERELEMKRMQSQARGKVVFALRDIAEGETITADALEAREIMQAQIPQGALGETTIALGKKARYGLMKGQIASSHDLNPYPPGYMDSEVQVVKEIRAGSVIKADSIKEVEVWQSNGLEKSSMAIGKKARHKLKPGAVLGVGDIIQ